MPVAIWISRSLKARASAVGMLAFVASIALHASAILARYHGPSALVTRPASDSVEITIEQEVEPQPSEIPSEIEPIPAQTERPASPVRSHRHAYPTPSVHSTEPHDPALVHPPLPSTSPELESPRVVSAPRDEPVRFAMRFGQSVTASASHGPAGVALSSQKTVEETPTFAVGAVDVPARLLGRVPTVYPAAARAAELEGEVNVEIVVDGQGSVVSARALTSHGLGLEAAAVRAVRGYRFSAALRQGRPVRVRMRWSVGFRLR